MNLVFIGPPGSGKGSVAKELVKLHPELRHISTGDLLRAKNLTAGDGSLNPDNLVWDLVAEETAKGDGWILDGFPRTLYQAQMLVCSNIKVDVVVHFLCDEDTVARRILSRQQCQPCNLDLSRFPGDRCPSCGRGITRRADDNLRTIIRRLDTYRSETEPCVQFLHDSGYKVLPLDSVKYNPTSLALLAGNHQ